MKRRMKYTIRKTTMAILLGILATSRAVKAVVITLILIIASIGFSASQTVAQTTAFTYQGRLTSNSASANGSYDFTFTLFDALTAGNQIATVTKTGVTVTNGIFTVTLDFGAAAFPGTNRFLEISAKNSSVGTFTTLTPRQQIDSNPYAIRSQSAANADNATNATNATNAANAATATNATQLGGIAASQYVTTTSGNTSFIQNQSASSQNANFKISGSGTVGNLTVTGTLAATLPPGSTSYIQNGIATQSASFNINGSGVVGGPFSADRVLANSSTTSLVLNGQSTSTIGTWLRLNNTSPGGNNWNLISSASGNGEGAGKLLFNNQTSSATRMQLDDTGLAVNGNLTVSGTLNATLPSGSTSYIQNTTTPQAGSNFNVSGNGTVGGNLTVSGTLNATITTSNFAALPNCKARQTSAQTLPNGNIVGVQLDSAQFCTGVTFDNTNDRLVIVTSGVYQISAEIFFLQNSSSIRLLEINSNLQGELASASANAVVGFDTLMTATTLVRLSAGEAVNLAAGQGSGGNLNTSPFNGRSASLSVNWVSP